MPDDLAAVTAAPEAFFWHRWSDACASFADPPRHDLHMRVLRWALDEMALPAPLLRDVLQRLYRENRLRHGRLDVSGRAIGLADIAAPVLAVVERGSRVVPEEEILPALAATSSPRRKALAYDGDAGPIEITLEQYRQRFRLVVADRGKGKASNGRGFGTRMLKAMIERLGGDMAEDSSPQGLRVILTAPIEAD